MTPDPVLERIRRALGRDEPLTKSPVPPAIPEPVVRLVHSDIGLPNLFAAAAKAAKFQVEMTSPETLASKLIAFLTTHATKRLGLPVSPLLEQLNLPSALQSAGFEVLRWDALTLDSAYDLDCGITDVYAAVAETGSLAIRPSPTHGRALSLVPPIHVAILEPKNFVADLLDLFELIMKENPVPNITMITGPSKTADIEGNLVTGVHGPGLVQLYILQ